MVPARSWRARNVVLLGFVSLLTDVASEMIIPLLPFFLTSVLGAGALALGWIEGAADGTASILKLVAGRLSDRSGRRTPLVRGGYAIASVARPLVAFATHPWHVLAVRVTDRIGKGLRSSPRDALIADSVVPEQRAAAFSLQRAMDHTGAVLGPLFAAAFLSWWSTDLRTLFLISAIPGAAAVLVLVVGVREAATPVPPRQVPRGEGAAGERGTLLRLLVPLGLFTLGNASDVFLLLKAGAERASLTTLPLLWMALHIVKVAASLFGGRVADRWGRTNTIVSGWVFYALVYVGFAAATSQESIWLLFGAYGVYYGLTEGPERALVAELVPRGRFGSGFGWYYLTLGLLTVLASILFGGLWELYGSRVAFLVSAALALVAAVCLICLRPERKRPAPVVP